MIFSKFFQENYLYNAKYMDFKNSDTKKYSFCAIPIETARQFRLQGR